MVSDLAPSPCATTWFLMSVQTVVSSIPEGVTERKLDYHGSSTVLDRSVAVKSSVAANGNRTVVLTRSRKGTTAKHYTFDPSTTVPLPIITARGCGMVFAQYHCGHGLTVLIFF